MSNKDNTISNEYIQNRIFSFRGNQVMVDRDLADMYDVSTKVLNQAVKRNISRFPIDFRFQLSDSEKDELVTNCDHLSNLKFSPYLPYVYTEQGVAMLSAVLKSDVAVKVSVKIMKAFVEMKKTIYRNSGIFQRIERLELKQVGTEEKIMHLFHALDEKQMKPSQGVFYEGQVFDAFVFVVDLIKTAKASIVLIDNYIDETTLMLFSNISEDVKTIIYTKRIDSKLELALNKYNSQYSKIELKRFSLSHDRFLIIDDTELYHFGASLKDLGKKWFAFSKMNMELFSLKQHLMNNNY